MGMPSGGTLAHMGISDWKRGGNSSEPATRSGYSFGVLKHHNLVMVAFGDGVLATIRDWRANPALLHLYFVDLQQRRKGFGDFQIAASRSGQRGPTARSVVGYRDNLTKRVLLVKTVPQYCRTGTQRRNDTSRYSTGTDTVSTDTGLDNLDGDDEPTPQSNDVDVEAGEPETSQGPDKEWKNERDNAITLFEDLFKEYQGLYGTVQEETAPPPPPKSKKGFAGIVGGLLAKKGKRAQSSTSSSGTIGSSHNELTMYQGVPCDYDDDDVDFDVLGWWKRNEHMFPCLGMLARQVLSVPVSTVAVEREFSVGGNILTDYRSCLNAESLETLVCNQDWLLARRRAQESSYQLESEHYMNATTDGSPSSEE
ncbi:hypothetical protein DM860_012243 [Cuscuta australis]|uniref:HAT C-terminal dimerisation domain-containing protein n=1 Tax=Cuscuta australis TaxID=267555 RepID=A0A328EAD9_9ASTE|nr:hypothetical protein DM860_012243 [Cuscuta australis]